MLLGGASGVGAHQHRHAALLVELSQLPGDLPQRLLEHQDVVGGGVTARIARPAATQPPVHRSLGIKGSRAAWV
ncbi:hypothetical protein GCM10027436_69040 [Actinophytocola sediminis]